METPVNQDKMDRLFQHLLAEPDAAPDVDTLAARAALRSEVVHACASGAEVDHATLTAYLDGALSTDKSDEILGSIIGSPEGIYELESAQAFLGAVAAETSAAPADLVAAAMADAQRDVAPLRAPLPARRASTYSVRQWRWVGGAMAAVLAVYVVSEQFPAQRTIGILAPPSTPRAIAPIAPPPVTTPDALTGVPPETAIRAVPPTMPGLADTQRTLGQMQAPAFAPPPPPDPEDVLITGSLIQGAPAVGVPVTALGEEAFADVGGFSALRGRAAAAPAVVGQPIRNTERYPDATPNPVKSVAAEPLSTFSVDVDTASYSNLRRILAEGRLPPTDAVRVEEMINYFSYSYAQPRDRTMPFASTVAVYPTPWNPDTQIVHIGIKGYDVPRNERPNSNLVFLIDTSGSMADEDKLPLLKRSFRLLVEQMGENDTVSMVVYAGSAGTVLEPTRGSDKARILAALDRLESGGSTAGGAGIRLAYDLAKRNFNQRSVNRVILATDGDFNVGITDPNALEDFVARERSSGVFLTVLGFGGDNYNDLLMQKLAQAGNGAAAYIDTMNEARKVFVEQLSGTLFTIAKDVKLQVEFNPARVAEYRLIGYETRALANVDFNNDAVDAGDIGAGHTVTALYEITPVELRARAIDPLRYGAQQPRVAVDTGEYAFLKIRYKLPAEDESKLIERPITNADVQPNFARLPDDIRFAAVVAGAGQLIRHDPYIRSFDYERAIALANAAKGGDEFGYRAEFIDVLRRVSSLSPLPSGRTGN